MVTDGQKNRNIWAYCFSSYGRPSFFRLPHFSDKKGIVDETFVEIPDVFSGIQQGDHFHGKQLSKHQTFLSISKKWDSVDRFESHLKFILENFSNRSKRDLDTVVVSELFLDLGCFPNGLVTLYHFLGHFYDQGFFDICLFSFVGFVN